MEDIWYINSRNQKLNLTQWPYQIADNDLLSFAWSYSSQSNAGMNGGKILSFTRGITTKHLMITIAADTPQQYYDAINQLNDLTGLDIMNVTPGRLQWGNQYMTCYMYGSSAQTGWNMDALQMDKDFSVVSPYPFWITERTYEFPAGAGEYADGGRYAIQYPRRYANSMTESYLVNESPYDTQFRMSIYGPVREPLVMINGCRYYVNIQLETDEYLEIDSRNGTIYKTRVDGEKENCFHLREMDNAVFTPISSGKNRINWSGKFRFDLTLFEERSEPRWQ